MSPVSSVIGIEIISKVVMSKVIVSFVICSTNTSGVRKLNQAASVVSDREEYFLNYHSSVQKLFADK
jgi:hypothetical protein